MAFAHWRLLYFAFVFALGGGLLDSFFFGVRLTMLDVPSLWRYLSRCLALA